MERTALPIGTIIQVEGNSEPFMICQSLSCDRERWEARLC